MNTDAGPLLVFDAWQLPPATRHRMIFQLLAMLPQDHTLRLVNDHDPIPVYYQLQAEQPGQFRYESEPPQGPYFFANITRIASPPGSEG